MFENLIKEIKKLEGTHTISVNIESDEDGYFDKECPNSECEYQFKVHSDDWNSIFRNEEVFCPMCGKSKPKDHFYNTEQMNQVREKALDNFRGTVNEALSRGARKDNIKNKGGVFSLKVNVRGNSQKLILLVRAKEEIERKEKCSQCNARFAVIGSAYFCPSCCLCDIDKTYDSSMNAIKFKITKIQEIEDQLREIDVDQAINTSRVLLENSIGELVTAFQRFNEHKFKKLYPTIKVKKNSFQNLEIGSNLWLENHGFGYDNLISEDDLSIVSLYFQRRHVLEHQQGIVDEHYVTKVQDSYSVGERLVIKPNEVMKFYTLLDMLISKIRELTL